MNHLLLQLFFTVFLGGQEKKLISLQVDKEYNLIELDNVGGQNKTIVKGAELINGLQLNLKTGEEKRFIIEKK